MSERGEFGKLGEKPEDFSWRIPAGNFGVTFFAKGNWITFDLKLFPDLFFLYRIFFLTLDGKNLSPPNFLPLYE